MKFCQTQKNGKKSHFNTLFKHDKRIPSFIGPLKKLRKSPYNFGIKRQPLL